MTVVPSPPDTLEVALSLARVAGWPVFPVKLIERDGHRDKKPLVKWLTEATTDPEQIATWWTTGVEREGGKPTPPSHLWIGIHAGRAGIIVGDVDGGTKRGATNLANAGVMVPPTFNYETGRGGRHHIFAAPPGEWTVGQNVPVRDVDIRAGHGLMVYYGPKLEEAPTLAPAPAWALIPRERLAVSTGTSVAEWRESCKKGTPGAKLLDLVRQVKTDGTSHDDMLRITREIVKLGTLGKAGAPEALDQARARYLEKWPSYAAQWDKAVEGSVDNWGPRRPDLDELTRAAAAAGDDLVEELDVLTRNVEADELDDDYAEDLAARVREMRLSRDARRLLAAEDSTGGDLLSWDDLEANGVEWLIDDLIGMGSVTFLVARANTGKTFAFIDMVCRMAHGRPWLGKVTRQAKTLIILGEGASGIIERFRAWCDYNGGSMETLKQWVSFAGQSNINSDDQLTKLQRHAADTDLIILDTYAATSGVESEDDAALNSITLNRARSINPEAAVFFTHHPRKSDEDSDRPIMRGSGALFGNADTVMTLYRDRAYIADDGTDAEFLAISTEAEHAGKSRNSQEETFRGLFLRPHAESAVMDQVHGEALTKWDRLIRRHLRGRMTLGEFCEASGMSERAARPRLNSSHYVIVHEGAGRVPNTYSLTANMLATLKPSDFATDAEPVEELTPRKRADVDG